MPTLSDSPFPINQKNPIWNDQVKVGRGRNDMGAFHRALPVAERMLATGQWNGRGLLIVHDPYATYNKMSFHQLPLVEGEDFEYANDSVYEGSGPAAPAINEPPAEDILRALLDYLSPETLAQMAHDMQQGGLEAFGDWGVPWMTEYELAYRRIVAAGSELLGAEGEFAQMVEEAGL